MDRFNDMMNLLVDEIDRQRDIIKEKNRLRDKEVK